MASRHRRLWTSAETERFIAVVLNGRDAVRALMDHAPVSSPEYQELVALMGALHRAACFLGKDWAHPNPPAGRGP